MNEELLKKVEQIRSMGIQYTFDGFEVSDFIMQLDKVLEIKFLDFSRSRLSIWTGDLRNIKPEDLLALIPSASLLNVAASAIEESENGQKLWFEWILPKTFYDQ